MKEMNIGIKKILFENVARTHNTGFAFVVVDPE